MPPSADDLQGDALLFFDMDVAGKVRLREPYGPGARIFCVCCVRNPLRGSPGVRHAHIFELK
eukprot:365139-Chlamydomonas_euryale.AAC.19